jgi:hypothetical protein
VVGALALLAAGIALAGAVSTTDNPGYAISTGVSTNVLTDTDGTPTDTTTTTLFYSTQACRNSSTNCNIYFDKRDVWTSGLPGGAALPDGNYFLAVLDPGGQRDPNDGTQGNLSDDFDSVAARAFSVTGGTIAALSTTTHVINNNKIQLWQYANTLNPGGVYILAVCTYTADDPNTTVNESLVDPHNCKYDAFKVTTESNPSEPAQDLSVAKTAVPSFTRSVTWGISKKATPSSFTGTAGSTKSISYEVDVSHHYSDSGYQVTGTVTVGNTNLFDVTGVTVSDSNSSCNLYNGTSYVSSISNVTVTAQGTKQFNYLCNYSGPTAGTNTATATWPASFGLPHNSADSNVVTWASGDYSPTLVNGCTNVTDTRFVTLTNTTGLIATLCLGNDGNPLVATGYNPDGVLTSALASGVTASHVAATTTPAADAYFKLTYSKSFTIGTSCASYVNTAAFAGSDGVSTGTSQASVRLCPAVNGLTIGYWQNKNGQGQINTGHPTNTCQSLYNYLTQFNPFKDLTSSTCGTSAGYTQMKTTASTGIAGYVYDKIKLANASGASMNAMLKAQMLGTALSVYFSTSSLGSINIDLTKICNMIDSSGGTATCGTGGYLANVGNAFTTNGTLPATDALFALLVPSALVTAGGCTTSTAPTAMIVECLLWNAASWSDSGGVNWYSNNKTTQGLAKNTFDAINNGTAVAAGP